MSGLMDNIPYIYNDIAYKYMAIHRQVSLFDPLNTDNPIIIDYYQTFDKLNKVNSVIYQIMDNNLNLYDTTNQLPASYKLIIHKISISWSTIIQQMLFIDGAFETFYAEYKEIIDKIILTDTQDDKDSLIYRHLYTGISIFHVAAQLWLYKKQYDSIIYNLNIDMTKELSYIYNCYGKLEKCIGDDRTYCILYMTDFSGITLTNFLEKFVSELTQ